MGNPREKGDVTGLGDPRESHNEYFCFSKTNADLKAEDPEGRALK